MERSGQPDKRIRPDSRIISIRLPEAEYQAIRAAMSIFQTMNETGREAFKLWIATRAQTKKEPPFE